MKHEPIQGGTLSTGLWHVPVEYDVSNTVLMAQYDGVGGIRKYSVAGKWRMLKEASWYCGWSVNGEPAPNDLRKRVTCRGKKQRIEYDALRCVNMSVEQFCHPAENALYTVYRIHNSGGGTVTFDLHFGFEIDLESYYSYRIRRFRKAEAAVPVTLDSPKSFTMSITDDFSLQYSSNVALEQLDHEAGRCNIHYRLLIAPGQTEELSFVLTAGAAVSAGQLDAWLAARQAASAAVDEENVWLEETFRSGDQELNALYGFCLNASLSSFKDLGGGFRGYFAGIDYQSPPRTYFRDGYWTVLPSLPYKPEWVRDQILTLANGILENGSCPSAVIYNQDNGQYEPFWPDHYDSPSFFVMMIYDYLAWTRDFTLLQEPVNGNTVENLMERTLGYLTSYVPKDGYLFIKPENRRDWADNVVREGYAVYDLALYIRALSGAESIYRALGRQDKAEDYGSRSRGAKEQLKRLLQEEGFFNYKNSGGAVEPNLSIELSLLVLYGILDEAEQKALLAKMTEQLETRNNKEQLFGDWGTMAVYPFYKHVHHLVEKTMAPYRYHNGGDWPYMDGIYAWSKLWAKDEGWRYPLTRWFQVSLENGWLTPVEYYGPVYGKGSNLQGWSSMPAAAMLMGGAGLWPRLEDEKITLRTPPWGDCTFKHIRLRGRTYELSFQGGRWEIQSDSPNGEHPFATEQENRS
jgi:glycogen debranching enzyme